MKEVIAPPPFTVTRITEGLNFGEGYISGDIAEEGISMLMHETIQSTDILIPVERDDDGCSDGRLAIVIMKRQQTLKNEKNHVRAKVFGGAVVMAGAIRIGLGIAGDTLLEGVFGDAMHDLGANDIKYGAHTAEKVPDGDSGCGALDRAPEALWAALKFENQIRAAIHLIVYNTRGLDFVFDNFRQYFNGQVASGTPYSGRKVMDQIEAADVVVKKLGGEHLEKVIVLNKAKGLTVNQRLVRLVTGDKAQVFAVDVWRLEEIADKLCSDQPELKRRAILSELVYTIATSAVLTNGDLPIYLIDKVPS